MVAFLTSVSPWWHLESLTIGPMCHEADHSFWGAALKDFPKLPHLTQVKIIYNYRTHRAFNTSCWDRFGSILPNRAIFPRLEVVDVCPTIRSQSIGYHNLFAVRSALSTLKTSGQRLEYWGQEGMPVFLFN